MGVPWRVTDFITVGTPLTHARDLLSTKHVSFDRRLEENERARRSSPYREEQHLGVDDEWARRPSLYQARRAKWDGCDRVAFYRSNTRAARGRAQASPFATTRWTNLYFPMRWWLGGDPVGGKVAPAFGEGVVDIEVEFSGPKKARRRVMAFPVGAHTKYWTRTGPGHEKPEKESIARLRQAMLLRWRPTSGA